jgi:hypothetical protein
MVAKASEANGLDSLAQSIILPKIAAAGACLITFVATTNKSSS